MSGTTVPGTSVSGTAVTGTTVCPAVDASVSVTTMSGGPHLTPPPSPSRPTDSPGAAPTPRVPAVESAEFCCVLRSRLGRHSLVYGAEVDGVDPHCPGEQFDGTVGSEVSDGRRQRPWLLAETYPAERQPTARLSL